jgi:hypothetical protein
MEHANSRCQVRPVARIQPILADGEGRARLRAK